MQGNHNAFILINKMQNSTKIFPINNTTVQHWVKTESGVFGYTYELEATEIQRRKYLRATMTSKIVQFKRTYYFG
jgi:hypothetical protein